MSEFLSGPVLPDLSPNLQSRLLVKCDDELLDAMRSSSTLRQEFAKSIKDIQAASSSPINFVGTIVIPNRGYDDEVPNLRTPFDLKRYTFSIQEVWYYDDIVLVDKELI